MRKLLTHLSPFYPEWNEIRKNSIADHKENIGMMTESGSTFKKWTVSSKSDYKNCLDVRHPINLHEIRIYI